MMLIYDPSKFLCYGLLFWVMVTVTIRSHKSYMGTGLPKVCRPPSYEFDLKGALQAAVKGICYTLVGVLDLSTII